MTIQLLGTGGADGIPGLFSETRVSIHARTHGGKDVRSRASALIDGHIKLDLGPDTWSQTSRLGLNPRDWSAVVFTHADADHFAIEELQYALHPFNGDESAGFSILGNNVVSVKVRERYPDWPFDIVTTRSFCPFAVNGYSIVPVKAMHGSPDEDTQNIIVCHGDKSMLYATDTGIWDEPTWQFLRDFKLDGLVLECSEGFNLTPYNGHLDVEEFRQVIERLREQGTLSDDSIALSTHHSHNGDATHEELEAELGPLGVTIGYDGLIVTI